MNKDYLKNFHANFYGEIYSIIKKNNFPYSIKKYEKQKLIFISNSKCDKVGILLNGNINIEHMLEDGKKITITSLKKYDIFGEILLFSNEPYYPYNIISITECEVLFITKEILLKIFIEDTSLLEKYLYHISESYMTLNKYIKLKSQKTIISKLAYYFIYYIKITPDNFKCPIKTKTQLAEFLGVERQSLIRELNKLKEQNLISYDKKFIYINDFNYFKYLIE